MNRQFYTLISFAVLAMLTASCTSDVKQDAPFPGNPISVVIGKVGSGDGGTSVAASGKLVARQSVNISTRMMGYVTSMSVRVGESVHAGQRLVQINNADLQAKEGQANAQIAQAQAHFNAAEKDYRRFQNLFRDESASQKELDDMRTRYEMAQAGLTAAQQMLQEVNAQYRYSSITAPIAGVVTAKFAEQGDLASPGMPLLTIESPSSVQAQVLVSEDNIDQMKPGTGVRVILKSSGKQVNGKIAEVSRSATNTGGQYIVKVDVANSEGLLPGMYVGVKFPFETPNSESTDTSRVMIPKSALVTRGQLSGVYTVSAQHTAILRWLKLGKEEANQVEVLSGLQPGDDFVLSADSRLFNGAKLKVE